jgi:N-acetylglucosamine-6-phosphate deacetylase
MIDFIAVHDLYCSDIIINDDVSTTVPFLLIIFCNKKKPQKSNKQFMQQAIVNCTIHTGEEVINKGVIVIEDSIIQSVQQEAPENCALVDLGGQNIAAGFIDIHINGGEKLHFSQSPTEAAIHDIYESSLQYGTTHMLPCLISSSHENILQGIEAIKNYRLKYNNGVMGMHLEGPFINPVKRGAHLAKYVRTPTNAELEEIIRYGKDVIKLITIAPECFTDEQLEMLMASGFVLSAGHSNATYEQAQYGFSKGIQLITHLFNAMTQFGHRSPGLVGASLSNDTVYTPIILDGAHCDYAAARLAYKCKKDKLVLISDALFLSKKKKEFVWEGFKAALVDGLYRNDEGNLAGATISMADAVRNAVKELDVTVDEAIKMATCRAAAAIKMQDKVGEIKAGFPASFVQFNNDLTLIEARLF